MDDLYDRMYKAAGCQISGSKKNLQKGGRLFGGVVDDPYAGGVNSLCACRTVNRDYDPANFKIKAPILYINGDADPYTPLSEAKSHEQGQTASSSRTFLEVKGGGHWSTSNNLSDCTEKIFTAAMSGNVKEFGIPRGLRNLCPAASREPALGSGLVDTEGTR